MDLKALPGFITGGNNLNNIRYAGNTVSMHDFERKLKKHYDIVANEKRRKVLNIKCENKNM